jgi:non-ribosomal peptide synthetase component F
VRWHAEQHPDRVAVVDQDGAWSYEWLDRAADRVARVLTERDIQPADHLGVIRRPSAAFVAAILGCLRAGATVSVVEAAGTVPTVLDVSPTGEPAEGTLDLSALFADHVAPVPADRPWVVGSSTLDGDRSWAAGSSTLDGDWAVERFGLSGDDRFAVLSTVPGHVLSAVSTAFHAGASLAQPPPSITGDPGALAGWLQSNTVTVVYASAPILRALARNRRAQLPTLRHVFVDNSGELICHDIEILRQLVPTGRCVAVYRTGRDGRPLAVYAVPDDWHLDTAPLRVPLGTDLHDNPAQLRHPSGQPAAIGEVAEICFGSYHTGDLGRRWADGTLEFVGKRSGDPRPGKEQEAT